MNNNNNSNRNNNRRRGRGNRQQGGGGNQNRIDSRARGNAPQMLDKYKKLAQDAQHNGDRVQQEYYLQFADHYFRVIADSRPRGDEQQQQRGGRRDEQDFSNDDDGDEDDFSAPRQSRDDRPRDDRQREDRQRDDRPREDRQDRPREDRPRGERGRNDRQRQPREQSERDEGERAQENGGTDYEPADNPFVRPSRTRTREGRAPRPRTDETAEMTGNEGEIDVSALPPSFSAASESAPEAEPERATRKLPPRRRRKPEGDAGEGDDNLTAVG